MSGISTKIRARLRDTRGFMLAEQLMSIVILGFLCLAVAAGLGVCITVQRDISAASTTQSLLSNAMQEIDDQLEFSSGAKDGETTFVSATTHEKVSLTSDPAVGIQLVTEDADKQKTLVVGENNGQFAMFSSGGEPTYKAENNTWTYTVCIVDGSGSVLRTQTATVKRIASSE